MSNGQNNWNIGYTGICFFEQVLSNHSAVASFDRTNDIQFAIVRKKGMLDVNAILVDIYMLGEAAHHSIAAEFNGVTVIVNNGHWNNIAYDARALAIQTGVETFLMGEFLGALNCNDLSAYVPGGQRKKTSKRKRKTS